MHVPKFKKSVVEIRKVINQGTFIILHRPSKYKKYFFSSKLSGFKLNIMLNLPVLSNTYSTISDSFSLKMFDGFLQRANC